MNCEIRQQVRLTAKEAEGAQGGRKALGKRRSPSSMIPRGKSWIAIQEKVKRRLTHDHSLTLFLSLSLSLSLSHTHTHTHFFSIQLTLFFSK
jgi:hypothetical protein